MNTTTTPIRFFAIAHNHEIDSDFAGDNIDTVEITERCFKELIAASDDNISQSAAIQYDRHTMFENGVDQVCLTLDIYDMPHVDELEVV